MPSTATVLGEGGAVSLYRGQWIEASLSDNQLVKTGGSVFSEELTVQLRLNFSFFKEQIATWTKERVDAKVGEKKAEVADQLTRAGIDLDPELVVRALLVQAKTDALLQVVADHDPGMQRHAIYAQKGDPPALSDFKGISACAERALIAKHLCDLVGMRATYMSGVAAQYDPQGAITHETDHSFLVLPNNGSSFVFDVARKCSNGWPRIVVMDHEMSLERFLSAKNLLVTGSCPFSSSSGKMLFGVGNPFLSDEVTVVGA
jgi:hypothetical protein